MRPVAAHVEGCSGTRGWKGMLRAEHGGPVCQAKILGSWDSWVWHFKKWLKRKLNGRTIFLRMEPPFHDQRSSIAMAGVFKGASSERSHPQRSQKSSWLSELSQVSLTHNSMDLFFSSRSLTHGRPRKETKDHVPSRISTLPWGLGKCQHCPPWQMGRTGWTQALASSLSLKWQEPEAYPASTVCVQSFHTSKLPARPGTMWLEPFTRNEPALMSPVKLCGIPSLKGAFVTDPICQRHRQDVIPFLPFRNS